MSDDQTPSARIIADAQQTTVLTDAKGRRITFRLLSVLDQARILKAIGPAQSENGPYVRLACIAASVVDIDGVPSPRITTDQQVEAAIGRLGDEGFVAISVEADRKADESRKSAEDAADAQAPPLAGELSPATPPS